MQKLFVFIVSCLVVCISACNTSSSGFSSSLTTRGDTVERRESINAQGTLHVIFVADTENLGAEWLDIEEEEKKDIGSKSDLEKMRKFVNEVEDVTGLSAKIQIIKGDNFSSNEVLDAINRLEANADDVILFYYTGHGRNLRGEGWPNLVLGRSESHQPELKKIVSNINDKGARFSILLADACNNYVKTSDPSTTKGVNPPKFNQDGYKNLFMNYRGYVVGVASKDDGYALGSVNGGAFTNQLVDALEKEAMNTRGSWEQVKTVAEKEISDKVDNGTVITQRPSIEIYTEQFIPSSKQSVSIKILPSTRVSLGDDMIIQFTNQSEESGSLMAWDVDSQDKVTLIVPFHEPDVRLELMETKNSTTTALEPVGTSYLVAVLARDVAEFRKLKGLNASSRQQLLNRLQQYGLKATVMQYEISR